MDNIITYVRPVSIFQRIISIFFLVFAFAAFFYLGLFVTLIMGALGVFLASTEGSQVNLSNHTHRTIRSMFDIHLGKWQDNPDFEYISVFKAREKQKVNGIAASTTLVDELFVVNLFYDRNKHKTFFKTYDKYEAFKVA